LRRRALHRLQHSLPSGRLEIFQGTQHQGQGQQVSEERIIPDAAEFASAASRATLFWTNVFQALPVACVLRWVLDVPRQIFNISLYTEQLLTACLGLTLALAYIADTSRPRRWSDWAAVIVSLGLCGYIAVYYPTLTDEIALLPVHGTVVAAIL